MPIAIRSTAALAAAMLVATTGWAGAQGLGMSSAYVKLFGGVSVPQDENFTLNLSGDDPPASGLDYDTGFVFGIAGGYLVTPSLALEIEYAYRSADAELDFDEGVSGQMKANSYMANAIYTFNPIDAAGAVRPYVGVGLGAADLTYEPDGAGRLGGDLSFAYQAMAGVGYQMNESWTLTGEIRYLGVSEEDVSADFASFETKYQTFDALVGATYRF